ncbi:MAG: MCE family protein [Solirubrobacterales bacterium]|nr:MCE family protein [Solirubrobacterales bacterium]
MSRRGQSSIVANPVLVGAVTTLVVTVAVFLAYNANAGLPFVPTTQLRFQVSNGANLLPGNEVREGGFRIGLVSDMKPVRLPDGSSGAEVTLKLDQEAGEVPVDSTVNLRPRSVLGLKYVELTRGRSQRTLDDGATLPADQASFPVELDELYSIFDKPTRDASQENLRSFGNAFTQRGAALNRTIADAPRFLRGLEPVARTLADEDTDLAGFFDELGDAARVVAPVADRYAHSFAAGADTFEAWSRDPEALRETISRSVPTLDTGIRSLRVQRPFLADLRDFSAALERVSDTLPRTLPRIIPALQTGAPVLRRSADTNKRLRTTLRSLDELMDDPRTGVALRGVTDLTGILNPLLRFVGPYVTVCNYFNYAWTYAGEHLTEPDPTGTAQRTILNQAPRTRNPTAPSVSTLGAREPVNGEPVFSGSPMNLHSNLYSAAINRDGSADCESGQRGYLERVNTFGDPKYKTVIDPHIPGSQGPTFVGRDRVPAGQTFSRSTQFGPKLPPELDP